MTDREMLELAAKAAGIQIKFWNFIDYAIIIGDDGKLVGWNPLKDKGDALSLAIKLKINISFLWDGENDQHDPVAAFKGRILMQEQIGITMFEEFDEELATCRAVVRVAAEIGKGIV